MRDKNMEEQVMLRLIVMIIYCEANCTRESLGAYENRRSLLYWSVDKATVELLPQKVHGDVEYDQSRPAKGGQPTQQFQSDGTGPLKDG